MLSSLGGVGEIRRTAERKFAIFGTGGYGSLVQKIAENPPNLFWHSKLCYSTDGFQLC